MSEDQTSQWRPPDSWAPPAETAHSWAPPAETAQPRWGPPLTGRAESPWPSPPPGARLGSPELAAPAPTTASSAASPGWVPSDRWLLVAATLTLCLAVLVFFGGFQYARATPRYEQAPPGMAYSRDGTTARVISIVAAEQVRTGVASKAETSPKGALFVVARVEISGVPDGFTCSGRLVLSDGRTFNETFVSKPQGPTCLDLRKTGAVEVGLYYLVPEESVPRIVGIAMDHQIGLVRTTVIRPPQ